MNDDCPGKNIVAVPAARFSAVPKPADADRVRRVGDAMQRAMRSAGVASSTNEYFDRMARVAIEEIDK